jgi:predicted O-methyltransferase YrrM
MKSDSPTPAVLIPAQPRVWSARSRRRTRRETLRYRIASLPLVGPALLLLYRLRIGLSYFSGPLREMALWLVRSKETTNWTYNLERTNISYLSAFLAEITGASYGEMTGYIEEIESDEKLRTHIADAVTTGTRSRISDREVRYGRRVGWYALVRTLKPKSVVETGVDKGLGACVITAALLKNRAEGYPGDYYGTDINPSAGELLCGEYATCGRVLYGDSLESLRNLDTTIDLFINDSDHSAEYEDREYQTIESKLSTGAMIVGDNCHETDKLLTFALATDRRFLFFHERPDRHWYRGGGIGVAFRRGRDDENGADANA